MKLSQFNNNSLQSIYYNLKTPNNKVICDFTDEQISSIVFSGIADNLVNCDIAIVFGNSDMILERAKKAVEMYRQGRVKLLLFTGGINGITATEHNMSEAEKMAQLAYQYGVPQECVLVESHSNNSFENVECSINLLKKTMDVDSITNIMIITSDFHLKRCYSIFLKHLPYKNYTLIGVKNGYSDEENWTNSELYWGSGRSIVTYEANILIQYAKDNKIADLEIENYPINRK